MKFSISIGLMMMQYSLLIAFCAALLSIPMPKLYPGAAFDYSHVLSALVFLIIGFYTGSIWNLKQLQRMKVKILWQSLSNREQEVAKLLLNNLSNQEISEYLFIEVNTVKTHLKNIYKKTKCNGRFEFRKQFENRLLEK